MSTLRIIFYSLGIVVMVFLLVFGFVELFGGAMSKMFLSYKADMISFSKAHSIGWDIGAIIVCIAVMSACLKGVHDLRNNN
jgi:hypothetical protein